MIKNFIKKKMKAEHKNININKNYNSTVYKSF